MAGQTSCITSGKVTGIGRRLFHRCLGKWLENQSLGDFYATEGDSGAPVFRLINGRLHVVGIQWGVRRDEAGNWLITAFSPMTGVTNELDPFIPYTIFCP
ncbi:MAG: hypothetical protein DDT28_00454 [Dehalococcoidia bacterium]|nr:hypothetical protein [Chloroflexota bacterium]